MNNSEPSALSPERIVFFSDAFYARDAALLVRPGKASKSEQEQPRPSKIRLV